MTLAKLISLLGLVASVLAAIGNQVGVISVKWGTVVMLISAIAAAAGGALSKYIDAPPAAAGLGLIVAVAAVFASPVVGDLIPPIVLQVIAIVGTAAAAAGASLFGWGTKPETEVSDDETE